MDIRNKQKQIEKGLRRGWIVYLLYLSHPKPLSFKMLIQLLDSYNFPLSHHRFAEKIEFLRGLRFVRVFPLGAASPLNDAEQAQLIQRFCDSDGDMDHHVCASLTTQGVNFQEGHFEETGVVRVN